MIYDNIKRNKNNFVEARNTVHVSYIRGPKVEIIGNIEERYVIQFVNRKTNTIEFQTEIKNNEWAKCNFEYFVDWEIKVLRNNDLFYSESLNCENKRVYISLESKALGDTLAWIPYLEEFRKKWNCELVASTFHNKFFKEVYKGIEFIEPGTVVNNLYAMYSIGLFYNDNDEVMMFKNPQDPKSVPMQQIATDILGMDYVEVKPLIKKPNVERDNKLITIAIHGTAQSKYWNNPKGWQEVVDWLNSQGYRVELISRENDGYMGNYHPTGIQKLPEGPLEKVIERLSKSRMFIGIGSGLSWLSWATNTPTALISGFSYNWTEMQDCIRIGAPEGKCVGCFNRIRLDAGDWNWCPDHKGTERQFECTKSITGTDVIEKLKKYL